MSVRRAGPDDVPAIAALVLAFGTEFDDAPDPGHEERVAAAMGADTTFLVAGEPPLGFVAISMRRPYWSARPEVHVDDLYVRPEHRGGGHGRALLQAAIAAAREQGAGHLELTTTEEDVAAAALYRAEGLRETEYDRPGAGRVIWFGLDL
jgi:ribosomal protein S18 acetylase RimI-like enzyme